MGALKYFLPQRPFFGLLSASGDDEPIFVDIAIVNAMASFLPLCQQLLFFLSLIQIPSSPNSAAWTKEACTVLVSVGISILVSVFILQYSATFSPPS